MMSGNTLPALPESYHVINTFDGSGILGMGQVDGYTADQMNAHAATLVARIAELEADNSRLAAEVARYGKLNVGYMQACIEAEAERDEARAEVDRLNGILESFGATP